MPKFGTVTPQCLDMLVSNTDSTKTCLVLSMVGQDQKTLGPGHPAKGKSGSPQRENRAARGGKLGLNIEYYTRPSEVT